MSYIWFNSVLEALGKRINFESISNLYGNSLCKEPDKVVIPANPLKPVKQASNTGLLGLIGKTKIINSGSDHDAAIKSAESALGDISWAGI